MPIDFTCSNCGAGMRAPDGTAGKKAKCPSCGEIVAIPSLGGQMFADENAAEIDQPVVEQPPAEPPAGGLWSGPAADDEFRISEFPPLRTSQEFDHAPADYDASNPYAAPLSTAPTRQESVLAGERDGPPWELDGPSFGSFFRTVAQAHGSRQGGLFVRCRRSGGLLAPWTFTLAAFVPAALLLLLLMLATLIANPDDSADALLGMVCIVGLAPVGLLLQLLVVAAIVHLTLMLVGGAKYPYEVTYRVVGYSTGVATLYHYIPCVGGMVGPVVWLGLTAIGLTEMHGTGGGKATVAVLLPVGLCCLGYLALIFAA